MYLQCLGCVLWSWELDGFWMGLGPLDMMEYFERSIWIESPWHIGS